jgi:hypothetical protein
MLGKHDGTAPISHPASKLPRRSRKCWIALIDAMYSSDEFIGTVYPADPADILIAIRILARNAYRYIEQFRLAYLNYHSSDIARIDVVDSLFHRLLVAVESLAT